VRTKNMTIIEAAAADLGQPRLKDALAVLVVMPQKQDPGSTRRRLGSPRG